MKKLWLIAMVVALGFAGCERQREREREKGTADEGTTPPTEQPGTVSPAPETPGMQEGTGTGETRSPGERTSPEPQSDIDADAAETTTPGRTGREQGLSDEAMEGTATAPAYGE
jgi:hypothetical protein